MLKKEDLNKHIEITAKNNLLSEEETKLFQQYVRKLIISSGVGPIPDINNMAVMQTIYELGMLNATRKYVLNDGFSDLLKHVDNSSKKMG